MANVADADELDGEAPAKGPGRLRKILLIAVPLLALGAAGGGAAWYFGLLGGAPATEQAAEAPPEPAFFYQLPEMTVNLASTGARPQFLKLKVALETRDKNTLQVIPPVEPRVLDTFQLYLREMRSTDLEGSAGLYRLKEELLRRVNLAIHPGKVDRVLFNEIIVQ